MSSKSSKFKVQSFKLAVILIVFIFFQRSASAQNFGGGIIGGVSTSQISGDGLAGYHQLGVCVGGMATLKLNEKWSTQFEILFIQKGSSTVSSDTVVTNGVTGPRYYNLRLNYIEVPILINYHYKKFIFEAGPSIAVLLSSSEEDIYGPIIDPPPFRSTDLSLNVGLTYPLYKNFMLNARFSNSLLYVRDTPSLTYLFNEGGQFNSVIQFTFRYYFNSEKLEQK